MLDYIDEEALLYILSLDGDSSYIAATAMDEILKRQKQNDIILQVVKIAELKTRRESRAQKPVLRTAAATSVAASARQFHGRTGLPAASRTSFKKASYKIKKVIRLALSTIVILQ